MKKCSECGSEKIIKDAILTEEGFPAKVAVDSDPDAMIFKQREETETRAEVCGNCGFIKLFVKDTEMIWMSYSRRKKIG